MSILYRLARISMLLIRWLVISVLPSYFVIMVSGLSEDWVNLNRSLGSAVLVVVFQVLLLCKQLQDSLFAEADKNRAIFTSNLIKRSLDRLFLDKEPERALNFYVDVRSALSNNDDVIAVSWLKLLLRKELSSNTT